MCKECEYCTSPAEVRVSVQVNETIIEVCKSCAEWILKTFDLIAKSA